MREHTSGTKLVPRTVVQCYSSKAGASKLLRDCFVGSHVLTCVPETSVGLRLNWLYLGSQLLRNCFQRHNVNLREV